VSECFTVQTPPSAPQDLVAAMDPGAGEITLDWEAPASDGGADITNYRIYRGPACGEETFLVEVGNVTSYTDSGLDVGVYYYQVSAVNAVGEGARSNEAWALAASAQVDDPAGTAANVAAAATCLLAT